MSQIWCSKDVTGSLCSVLTMAMACSSGEQSHKRLGTASVLQRGLFPCYSLQWYLIFFLLTGFLLFTGLRPIGTHICISQTSMEFAGPIPSCNLCLKTARYTMRSRSLKVWRKLGHFPGWQELTSKALAGTSGCREHTVCFKIAWQWQPSNWSFSSQKTGGLPPEVKLPGWQA